MPQFPMTPSREKILARLPDYAVKIEAANARVTVSHHGTVIAESTRALTVKETKHADVYYLPRDDINMNLFTATDHSTYCPFKGHASYWNLDVNKQHENNVVWSYESPYAEVEKLKGYMSFYTDRTRVQSD